MRFEKEKIGEVTVIRINEPRLTSHDAPEMKTTMLGIIRDETDRILINLKNVAQMDSTGLGSILFGIRQAEQHDKDMRFCETQSKVEFLIKIAHLKDVIQVYDSEAEALEDFLRDYNEE